jgi:hypothetical protein
MQLQHAQQMCWAGSITVKRKALSRHEIGSSLKAADKEIKRRRPWQTAEELTFDTNFILSTDLIKTSSDKLL